MIDRYSRLEMARIWSQEAKYASWLRVELAVCEVYARRGLIPGDALNRIKAKARVDPSRIDEIEQTTRHDVIAFLTNLEESIGTDSRYVHIGMTSSDVLDTALGRCPGRPTRSCPSGRSASRSRSTPRGW